MGCMRRIPTTTIKGLDNIPIEQGANTADILLTPIDMPVGARRFRGYDFGTGGNVSNMTLRITAPNGRSMISSSGPGSNSDTDWQPACGDAAARGGVRAGLP
jgi:hypothetical protein